MTSAADAAPTAPLEDWLERLARPQGAPGGGAAAAVVLSASAALLSMVAGYSGDGVDVRGCRERVGVLRADLLRASVADAERSLALGEALALDASDPSRDLRLADAAEDAARSSADLVTLADRVLDELRFLDTASNPSLVTDLAVAAHLLVAGAASTLVNLDGNRLLAARHRDGAGSVADLQDASSRVRRIRDAAAALAESATSRATEG